MANDEEMFVLFEDFERERRQFYHGQSPFTNMYNWKLFPKTFSFNQSIHKPQTRSSRMDIFFCPSLYVNLGENFPDKRSGSFCSNSTNLLFWALLKYCDFFFYFAIANRQIEDRKLTTRV
jgi:hypothetical protein